MTQRFILRFTWVIVLMFVFIQVFPQDFEKINPDSLDINKALSIEEISSETEKLIHRISELKGILRPVSEVQDVDSLIEFRYIEIKKGKDSLYQEMDQLTRRELKIREVEWIGYKSKLKSIQEILTHRTIGVNEVSDELKEEFEKWRITQHNLLKNNESAEVHSSVETMITALKTVNKTTHLRLDSLFALQKKVTELVLIVDAASSEINRMARQKQKEYFVLDSDPIWTQMGVDTTSVDTSLTDSDFRSRLSKDLDALQIYAAQNTKSILLQITGLLFLLTFIFRGQYTLNKGGFSMENNVSAQLQTIFKNPISATLVLGILFTSYLYGAAIPIFGTFQILVVLIATSYLLPQITHKSALIFMLLLLTAYLIEVIDVYLEPRSLYVRFISVLESGMLVGAMVFAKKTMSNNTNSFGRFYHLYKIIVPIYLFVLGVSVLFNIIGMVNLSDVLLSGVLLSLSLGMVIFVAIRVLTGLLILIFQLRKSNNVQALSVMVEAINRRFKPILFWVGIILWVVFTLKGFDVYENLLDWFDSVLQMGWRVGETRISLGSVISFFFLFIGTLVSANVLSTIFQDEWLIQSLPRGIAPAISLMLRILVISVGLYWAFTSAGFNLSELGFVFGALGVGIGFGLQSVVLNFIAGLILAFERPINLGDSIEVDQEEGVVTSIGVRSSNIRTWSGSEAIIPNGDLISKKVVNWTLTNRDRRSKVRMRTAPNADPDKVIKLFNKIAAEQPVVYSDPAPKTYFYGYGEDGNLDFALLYWTTFSDTLKTDSAIALAIFNELREQGIDPPMPNQRNYE